MTTPGTGYAPGLTAHDEAAATEARRGWAAMMLTPDLATCRSILRGLRVRAGNLDGLVLRRGLRGGPLPDAEAFIEVTAEMLDAVAEAGPLTAKGECR
jgi:hypothetical protein